MTDLPSENVPSEDVDYLASHSNPRATAQSEWRDPRWSVSGAAGISWQCPRCRLTFMLDDILRNYRQRIAIAVPHSAQNLRPSRFSAVHCAQRISHSHHAT